MNVRIKFEVRSFTRPSDNRVLKNNGQSPDMPTHPFLQNFKWAFVRMDPVNVPAKFEVLNSLPEIIAST